MEDISFARKYRPKTLEEYIGNQDIVETVKNIMKSGRKPQSILLTGNTGCGKTTLARILEKWYMCEEPHEDGSPCNDCVSCKYMEEYIETGNSEMLPDIQEIDVSEKSGKSDMDKVLEEVNYPAYNGWKVFLFDECHAMSTASATRLLKVVEEPPENVLFIFCTTDPQKMLETLKNRCELKLPVEKPSTGELVGLLKKVCLIEDKEYDLIGLRMIAARADYVIRDSLNYLERVIKSRGDAKSEHVSKEFKEVSDKIIFDFYEAYIEKNYMKYINIMYKIKTTLNFNQFLATLTSFTTRGIYILNNVDVEGLSEEEIKSYLTLFKRFSTEEISYVLSSLRRMSVGDVEANLMSFIYTDFRQNREDLSGSDESQKFDIPEGNLEGERKLRNNNLKILEEHKLKKGAESLSESMKQHSIADMKDLFQLEKVNK